MKNIDNIETKEEFLKFLENLRNDFINNKESWENIDLDSYFESMIAWVSVMERVYQNREIEMPENTSWSMLANILYAPKIYE